MGKVINFLKMLFRKLFERYKVYKECPKCHHVMDKATSDEGKMLVCSHCGYKVLAKYWGKVQPELPKEEKKETYEEKSKREFEEYLKKLIDRGMKEKGLNKEDATKWAWRYIEQKMERRKEKAGGTPITCSICHKYGCNKETGPYIKNPDGKTYRHQNCQ